MKFSEYKTFTEDAKYKSYLRAEAKKQKLTPAQTKRLFAIEDRIQAIENGNPDYDATPKAIRDEHEALVKEKFDLIPSPMATMARKMVGRK